MRKAAIQTSSPLPHGYLLIIGAIILVLTSLPAPARAQDDPPPEEEATSPASGPTAESMTLERINQYRVAAGLRPMVAHPALTEAAAGHVRYYEAHHQAGTMVGMGLHEQQPDTPGFTGASMRERARAAGYTDGAVTENAGFGSLDAAVDWYIGTVNHRLPLLHPSALDIGLAHSASTGFGLISVGLRGDMLDTELPAVYPPNGATGVPTAWDGLETPDPAPGVPRPLGYPITVAFARYQQVEWRATELRDGAGQLLDASAPRTDWMRAVAIIPHQPLSPGATYTVRIEAVVDGATITRESSFTTRP